MSWDAVVARRMARHALDEPVADARSADAGLPSVARALCGVHAQIASAAELSAARRVAGATRADVRRALWEERSLVKTFGPRGTIHLLPAADLPMWTGALSVLPSPKFADGVRFTADQAEEVLAAIDGALGDAELTVDELTGAIADRAGHWAVTERMEAFGGLWPRWRQLTSAAAHRGLLCFGKDRGRKVTYTSPRRWMPGFRPADSDTGMRELVTWYLHAYGPASPRHFARWLGIAPRQASEIFAQLGDSVSQVLVDGDPAWVLAGDGEAPPDPHRGVRLLPYFDAYVVGGQPRELLYPGPAAERALTPSGQAGNYPVLLIDGVVGGVWHQRRSGRRLAVTIEPLRELTPTQRRELDDEISLVGAIMDARPVLTIGPVTAGAHA
jgi:hypothetical protein